jgi:predicted RNA-binding Zn ribbon-like protein
LVPQLSTNGDAELLPASVSQVLATLARDLIDLVAGPFADRIRQCASDDCTLYLVDTSRPNQRRWCSMELCGNRSKLRDFRERQRSC